MNLLQPNARALIGALVGGLGGGIGVALANLFDQSVPFTVLIVLVIALIGLGLGAAAALYGYAAAGIAVIAFAILPARGAPIPPADLLRLATFVLGTPLIVFLALRAEVEKQAAAIAREMSDAIHQRALEDRLAAEQARRALDEALRVAERERARLEEVAEAIPEPLIVYDGELRGTYANRAALRTFGRSFVERPLEEWGRAVEPRDVQGSPLPGEEWPQVLAQNGPIRRRLTVRLPMSGRDLNVDVEGTPIPGGGCVLLLRDVGKEEEERRRLSQFASFVAHELRNPLAVARARIELAERDPDLSDPVRRHGRRALESVDAAIGILERLELFSRAETGRIEARRERFDLPRAIELSIERLRARGSERQVTVRGDSAPAVFGDQHLAELALTNLLTNAERYSRPGTPIDIEVTDGEFVTVRVRDEGPGIDDDLAERVFRDRVTAGKGLGLGLYLVRATMEAQGGAAILEQRRPGTVFALCWPTARGLDENGEG